MGWGILFAHCPSVVYLDPSVNPLRYFLVITGVSNNKHCSVIGLSCLFCFVLFVFVCLLLVFFLGGGGVCCCFGGGLFCFVFFFIFFFFFFFFFFFLFQKK